MVRTTNVQQKLFFLVVLPLSRNVKDRLSSWLSVQTQNNFGGIIGKIFTFETIETTICLDVAPYLQLIFSLLILLMIILIFSDGSIQILLVAFSTCQINKKSIYIRGFKCFTCRTVAMKSDGKDAFNFNILLFFLGQQKDISTYIQLMPQPSWVTGNRYLWR